MKDYLIRLEQKEDDEPINNLLRSAFPSDFEARLVRNLRQQARPYLGLLAENKQGLLGQILFTPVQIVERPEARVLGLGPMAVEPTLQGQGIGSRLVKAGLSAARDTGADAVFVLGYPDFYHRFGFSSAKSRGFRCSYEAPDDAFMLHELRPGGLDQLQGLVCYHPAFDEEITIH